MKVTYGLISLLILLGLESVFAQPVINSLTENSISVDRYTKFELTVDLSANFINPFNYTQVSLQAIFISPSNVIDTVDGFYYQNYSVNYTTGALTKSGATTWKIRYTPKEIGTYTYIVKCTDTQGTTSSPSANFTCTISADRGFVRKSASSFLKFDNNSTYFAVGENLCWYDYTRLVSYKRWMDSLALNKANFMRLWMASWSLGIEWNDTTIGNYAKRSDRAFELDWIANYAQQKGIYFMLSLVSHGQFSTTVDSEWANCPYNSANGGPCLTPSDFFTNAVAKNLFKQRLRYINARWGYSPSLMTWEFFNEVNWVDNFSTTKTQVAAWHSEMANYLRKLDVNDHLISTSIANAPEATLWNLPEIDYTQIHSYSSAADQQSAQVAGLASNITTFGKPSLLGEFGFPGNGSLEIANDPTGINFHNTMWATAFSGSFGSGATWWWDNYVDKYNIYRHMKGIASFASDENYVAENYQPASVTCTSNLLIDYSISPGYSSFAKCPANSYTVTASGITPVETNLGTFVFGSSFNTANRNPPTFHVNYTTADSFIVITGSSISSSTPKIKVVLDGVTKIDVAAAVNKRYGIIVPAGTHTIFVDDSGQDWITIAEYIFKNYTPALRTIVLKNTNKMIGWVQNRNYNWRTVKDNGFPSPITTGTITFTGVNTNGGYDLEWYNCTTGTLDSTSTAIATAGTLSFQLYNLAWDRAFKLRHNPLLSVSEKNKPAIFLSAYPNPFNSNTLLKYNVDENTNVKLVIYDVAGREIKTLLNEQQTMGIKQMEWNGNTNNGLKVVERGVYFCRIQTNNRVENIKIVMQ